MFAVLGCYSDKSGIALKDLIPTQTQMDFGPWIAFVAFPEVLSGLPLPWLWSALFFLMLLFVGLNLVSVLVETLNTALYDAVPKLRMHKSKVSALMCICLYLLGLPLVSSNGVYVADLMTRYGTAPFCLLWIGLWSVVSLMWIYGFKNLAKDI